MGNLEEEDIRKRIKSHMADRRRLKNQNVASKSNDKTKKNKRVTEQNQQEDGPSKRKKPMSENCSQELFPSNPTSTPRKDDSDGTLSSTQTPTTPPPFMDDSDATQSQSFRFPPPKSPCREKGLQNNEKSQDSNDITQTQFSNIVTDKINTEDLSDDDLVNITRYFAGKKVVERKLLFQLAFKHGIKVSARRDLNAEIIEFGRSVVQKDLVIITGIPVKDKDDVIVL